SHRLRAIIGHGVVSTGAQTPALFGFQSPGHYATFNSNHTPDGTVAVHAGDLVIVKLAVEHCHGARPPFSAAHRLPPSLRMPPRGSTMTATEDAYRCEFVWTDGDRLPFDAWRGRPVFVV